MEGVRSFLRGSTGYAPVEYIDFQLMRNVYRCTPDELDRQDAYIIDLHREIMQAEIKQKNLDQKRADQRSRKR